MAGHNKWSKVKNIKAVEDAKKSKAFSRLAHEITSASRATGGDTNAPELRAAIEKAKRENMPSSNIERAIQRGAGGASGNEEHVVYEAYGPNGCALIIEGYTDNRNRAVASVKHVLGKHGSSLAEQGATRWAFTRSNGAGWEASVTIPLSETDHEALQRMIDDLEACEDIATVYTNATNAA